MKFHVVAIAVSTASIASAVPLPGFIGSGITSGLTYGVLDGLYNAARKTGPAYAKVEPCPEGTHAKMFEGCKPDKNPPADKDPPVLCVEVEDDPSMVGNKVVCDDDGDGIVDIGNGNLVLGFA